LCQTYEEAFVGRFGYYIEIMSYLTESLGQDKLLDLIKSAKDNCTKAQISDNPDFSFSDWIDSGNRALKNIMTWQIIEKSDKIYEIRVTECLWAKIFRERNAADLGYATLCHGDFADAGAAHPKLRLERSKTLMQGHDCCDHRWVFEG